MRELGHVELCSGFIEEARKMRSNTVVSEFSFDLHVRCPGLPH